MKTLALFLLIPMVLFTALAGTGAAYERVVLLEEFTSTT